MRYIRRVDAGQKHMAAWTVEEWGYPRKISAEEVKFSIWYSFGPRDEGSQSDGVAWFAPVPKEIHESAVAFHSCSRPGVTLGTPRNMVAIEVIAELLGAERLYSLLPLEQEGALPVRAMRRYLTSKGWKEDAHGAYTDLGG